MNVPENLKYTKDHEWIRQEKDVAVIGITDYAQSEISDIVFVDVSTVGEIIKKEEVFGFLEAVKTVSDMMMPVTGEILELNPELEERPEIVNEDPYGEGWIIKIKPENMEDFNTLLNASDYKDLINK